MRKSGWIVTATLAVLLGAKIATAQITVTSLAQLKAVSGIDNTTITLAAGEYWIDGQRPDAAYLNFSGSNSVFDLSSAVFKIDTRDIAGYRDPVTNANADFNIVRLSGDGVTVKGLTLYGEDVDLDIDPDARRYPNRGAAYVQVSGSNNTLLDADISTRGSNPYGLGEAFGKGGRVYPQGEPPGQIAGEPPGVVGLPWIGHNKVSGVHIWEASNATVDNLNLSMQTYGHGLFIQKASDTVIRDSAITGEVFPASNVENHPLYIDYGNITSQGVSIPAGIQYSGHEDGIRAYGSIDGVPVTNITVENTVVTNMRNAYSTALARGDISLTNVETYGSELGFAVNGDTTIASGKGDIVNGPLLWYYNDGSDNDIELELVGGQPAGVDYSVAYVAGYDSTFTLTSDATANLLPDDSVIRLGQVYFENWRDSGAPSGPEDGTAQPMSNSRFANNTNRTVVIGESATRNVGYSLAPVISNGKENYYDGVTLVQSGSRLEVEHPKGLGNSGTELEAEFSGNNIVYTGTATAQTLDDNGTVVEDGATLELLSGIRIQDEKLTISGDGVDGEGALYSDGQTGSSTPRFGSSNGSDESTIFLDGDASIGVGIAGNQMLVGRIQGTGNLTKRGAGKLSIEKSSTFVGDLIVAAGSVAARSGVVKYGFTVSAGAAAEAIQSNAFNTTHAVAVDGELNLNPHATTGAYSATLGALSGSGVITADNAGGINALTLNSSGSANYAGLIEKNVHLTKLGTGTQALSGANTYTGTTSVTAGTLLINGSHTGGGAYTISGGTLGGTGSIDADITIESGGALAPGASAGQLTVEDLVFESGSTFEIEIGGLLAGSEYDQLLADTVTLSGDLSVSLLDMGGTFLPGSTDTFSLLSADSLSGAFENVANGARLDTQGGEGSFLVAYDSVSDMLLLSDFLSATTPGDFNDDGNVDGLDFLTWQRDDRTAAQLTEWQENYGSSAAIPSSVAVPEPSAACLLLLCSVLLTRSRAWLRTDNGTCRGREK